MSKTVLITGVAGFIGRYAARSFSKNGWEVTGVDVVSPENAPLSNLKAYFSLNLPDPEIDRILKDNTPDVCIHCAGRASVGLSISDPSSDFYDGAVLTFELLNALRQFAPACKFIFLSSAAVYGNPETLPVTEIQPTNPISPYGFHKLICEQLCREFYQVYGLPTAVVRIFSAYGPGLHRQVIWDICRKALTLNTVKLQGTGKESRDFIHAADIANALLVVARSSPMKGDVYNLASGKEVTIKALVDIILRQCGRESSEVFDGIIPDGTPSNWVADISKIRKLGFSPSISLEEGVKFFVDWCIAELKGV